MNHSLRAVVMYSAQLISLFWLENCAQRKWFASAPPATSHHDKWAPEEPSPSIVFYILNIVKHHLHVWSADVLVHEWQSRAVKGEWSVWLWVSNQAAITVMVMVYLLNIIGSSPPLIRNIQQSYLIIIRHLVWMKIHQ